MEITFTETAIVVIPLAALASITLVVAIIKFLKK